MEPFRTGELELQREKRKDYRNVVIIQTCIIGFGLTLSDFSNLVGLSIPKQVQESMFFIFAGIYFYLMWDLLKDFTQNKLIIKSFLVILILLFTTGLLAENPVYKIIRFNDQATFFLTFHLITFAIETVVIGYAIVDIFTGKFMSPDKLWGSAAVYLMIGIAFGELFHIIDLVQPGSLGKEVPDIFENYAECIYFSMNVLGGLEPEYPNPSNLVRNLGVIEAVWGNLFIVLLIGNLLGLPRLPKKDQ